MLEALHVLGDDYVALLKEGFNNRWIDVYENVGKRGGAIPPASAVPTLCAAEPQEQSGLPVHAGP